MMVQQGVDIIYFGGQPTRPRATRLATEAEVKRVLPELRSDKCRLHQFSDVGTCLCSRG